MNNLENELRFRSWVQTILMEELIHEQAQKNPEILLQYITESGMSGQGFIKAMTDPFRDVLNVAKVATKDLLSIAKFNFDMITTLSPSKQAEARKKWEARNKKLEGEWAEAMKPIDAAWEEGDMQLISFMMNPAGFLGFKAAGAVGDTAFGAKDMLDDAGIHLPFIGNKDKGKEEKEKDNTVDILGTGKKLLGDLTKLFFIAHHEPDGPLLAEAGEEDKKKEKGGSAVDGAQEYIDSIPGLQEKINKDAKAIIDSKREFIDEIMQMFEAQVTLLMNLANAQDLQAFLQAIQQAESAGVDVGGAGLGNFQSEIDKGVQNVLSNPESRKGFVKTYLEAQGQKVPDEKTEDPNAEQIPEVPDEKLVPEIQKVIFMDSKMGVQEQLFSGTQELKKQTTEAILEGEPEQKEWGNMKKTSLGSEYIGMFEEALKKIESV
jgi:hypothetical protein